MCVAYGAAATFTNCSFHPPSCGSVASGPGTTATLLSCKFIGCFNAIVAERGAAVHACHCAITDARVAAVSNGADTCVDLQDCTLTIKDARAPWSFGIRLYRGSASMRRCRIVGYTHALNACGHTSALELMDLVVSTAGTCDNETVGLMIIGRALACMRHTRLVLPCGVDTPCRDADGAQRAVSTDSSETSGSESEANFSGDADALQSCIFQNSAYLQVDRCKVRSDRGSGIALFGGSRLSATRCVVHSLGLMLNMTDVQSRSDLDHCIWYCRGQDGGAACAVDECELHLRHTRVFAVGCAIELRKSAKLYAVGCELISSNSYC